MSEEVKKLVYPYGQTKNFELVSDYPSEEFTETYHVQYARIQSARIAKRFIDGKNFYGGSLHVFYAPELESISETRTKLTQRRREIGIRLKKNLEDQKNKSLDTFVPKDQYHRRKKTPALPLTEERLRQQYPGETINTIFNEIPKNIDPRHQFELNQPSCSYSNPEEQITDNGQYQAPYSCNETIIRACDTKCTKTADTVNRKRNYKGQSIINRIKVKTVRPQLVNTSTIVKWEASRKNVFNKPKNTENRIIIKLLPSDEDKRKKIVIKNPSIKQLVQPSKDLQESIHSARSHIRAVMEARNTNES